mgnify:FL=1
MRKVAIIFPKDSEALFNKDSNRTFGGASVQMYLIAKEMKTYKNLEVFSFIPDYKKIKFDDYKRFNIIKTFREKDSIFKKAYIIKKKINEIKPDVIIQHGLTPFSGILAKYCTKKRIKFIFMFASDKEVEGKYQSNGKKDYFFKILLKNAVLISQNNSQKEYILKEYNASSIIIYNGFPVNKKPKNKYNVLWVSRCDKLKNPELFLDLAKYFKNKSFVMICPESSDKEFFYNIREKVSHIKNLKFISFVKFNDINKYFINSRIFVNTSDYEGFPQTFIQATMNGTPIISLNVNPNNFLDKYKCGFCANGDLELMKKQISKLLGDRKLWAEMSNNAYKYAKENHDLKKNVNKLLLIIKK